MVCSVKWNFFFFLDKKGHQIYPGSHTKCHREFYFRIFTTNQPLICALLSHFLVSFLWIGNLGCDPFKLLLNLLPMKLIIDKSQNLSHSNQVFMDLSCTVTSKIHKSHCTTNCVSQVENRKTAARFI